MAVNLIDRTKLDACLDAEADAIRAKTGDSNDLTFDFANNKGFADAIAAIPSGGTRTPVKLGEYTITEPVRTFSITLTQEMRTLDRLWIFTTSPITKDQTDYLYISLGSTRTTYYNSTTSNSVTGYFFNFPEDVQLGQKLYKKISIFSAIGLAYTAQSSEGSLATSVSFYTYSTAKKLTGGTIEVWG